MLSIVLASIVCLLVPQIESQTCSVSCPEGSVSVVLDGNQIACATPSPVNQALCLDSNDVNYTTILNPNSCYPPCANGGACVQYFVGSENIIRASGSYCVCPVPWKGSYCQTNGTECCSCTSSCDTTSCYNGGTCMMINGVPLCFCTNGFSGTHCELNLMGTTTSSQSVIDPFCSMCQNGGTCYKYLEMNSNYCACIVGYYGQYCEYHETTTYPWSCSSLPGGNVCQNGGSCYLDASQNPHCICSYGYYGSFCEQAITTTSPPSFFSATYSSSPYSPPFIDITCTMCQNGGTCYRDPNMNYNYCYCSSQYWGNYCELEVITSSTSIAPVVDPSCTICQNGGTCFINYTNYVNFCVCQAGTYGNYCEYIAPSSVP